MLRRLTLGLSLVACAGAIAACNSNAGTPSSGGVTGSGPDFVTDTIYVSNTTQQVVEIFTPSPAPSATPQYVIGGSNTTISGPQYLTFDAQKHLFVTNYNPATATSSVLEFQTFATGNVLPYDSVPLTGNVHARGIAPLPDSAGFVAAVTQSGGFYPNQLIVYSSLGLTQTLAGNNTGLNVPIGVAVDAHQNMYVANNGTPSVTIYAQPSATPSSSPTPTPTPTVSPSGSPSPSPPPVSNTAPITTLQGGSTQLAAPQGIALDSAGNLYVSDAGSASIPLPAKILIFDAPFGAGLQNIAPSHVIVSQNPAFVDPTDVAVDTVGNVYVIDPGRGPNSNSKLLIFAAHTYGTVTPASAITLPAGSAMGIALSP